MIHFKKFKNSKPDLNFSSGWLYLEDKNGVPVKGEFKFEENNLFCETKTPEVRLNIMYNIENFGTVIAKTTLVTHSSKHIDIEKVLLKGRKEQIKKELDLCEKEDINPGNIDLTNKTLSELFFLGEEIALKRAEENLTRRLKNGNAPLLNGQGFRIGSHSKYDKTFFDTFDEATIPIYFVKIFQDGPKPNWLELDNIINKFSEKGIPMQANHLVWLHEYNLPKWMKDLNKTEMKEFIMKFIDNFTERYGDKIANWSILNEIPDEDANFFNLTVDELIQWAKDIDSQLKRSVPEAKTYINISNPTGAGSFIQEKPAIPPLHLLEKLKKQNFQFDEIGIQFYFSTLPLFTCLDLLTISQLLNGYEEFNKPIRITEINFPSQNKIDRSCFWK